MKRYQILILLILFCQCREASHSTFTGQLITSQTVEEGNRAMAVTAHPLASKAAIEMIRKGGNAVDAMIAAHFALAVVYPRAGNIGGGGFMIYRTKEGQSYALDFREKAPLGAYEKMYQDEKGEVLRSLSLKGALASGVPGSVAGMQAAFDRFSKLKDWKILLEPAIRYARYGYVIDQREADRLNTFQPDMAAFNDASYCPMLKSADWKEGDTLVQLDLAATLSRIQKDGSNGFYQGKTAELIAKQMKSQGGLIGKKDLAEYEAIWRAPIEVPYKDCKMISMPPPSSGGVALGQLLEGISQLELENSNLYTLQNAHKIIELERRVYADRAEYMGDPDFVDVPVEELLNKTYLKNRLEDFDPQQISKSAAVASDSFLILPESFETTHVSIVDSFGNAVSMTTTLNSNFGSKLMVEGAGFFLNNEMDDFSAKPGVPNQFGLVGNAANAIAPEKRMLSSMTPTIFEKKGELYLVLGSPGGSTIITSVFQVFLWTYEGGLPVDEAIARGRYHHQWLPESVFVEGPTPDNLIHQLHQFGYPIDTFGYIGLVKAVEINEDGSLLGAGDPRSGDHAESW